MGVGKKPRNIQKTKQRKMFLKLTDQMTISGRWVVYAISVENTK